MERLVKSVKGGANFQEHQDEKGKKQTRGIAWPEKKHAEDLGAPPKPETKLPVRTRKKGVP